MSHDQRPSRVRVVAGRDATTAVVDSLRVGDVVASTPVAAAPAPVKRGMIVPSLVFCLGCALGGAGLGAAMLAR